MFRNIFLVILGVCVCLAQDVFKTSCEVKDIVGNWTFYLDEYHDEYYSCQYCISHELVTQLELKESNVVIDKNGNKGYWTLVNGLGFEAVIHGRKYYSITSSDFIFGLDCGSSHGWSHDVLNRGWSCQKAEKNGKLPKRPSTTCNWKSRTSLGKQAYKYKEFYEIDEELIENINSDPNVLWRAKKYEQFEGMTVGQTNTQSFKNLVKPVEASEELQKLASQLPENFDWRDDDGINHINKPRNQKHNGKGCGSCYAFASTGMNEARLNIASGGKINVTLSPQDVVNCSPFSYGCLGGYTYTGGMYAENFGMVEESCTPYEGKTNSCDFENRNQCKKHYFTNYEYIGGSYGSCNEESMLLALFKHGPIAAEILSDDLLKSYEGGIFHDIDIPKNFVSSNIVPVNHAVLIVGYGVEQSTKYWIVKNSWGDKWGENGYFRIRRGTNQNGIESSASQAFPIF